MRERPTQHQPFFTEDSRHLSAGISASVLLIGDMLHPIDHFAIELFLDGDMCHRRRWRRTVPVLFARCEPHHITGADFLDRSAVALRPATA
jgi:hypothetical protein